MSEDRFPTWFCTKCKCTWKTTNRAKPNQCARDHCRAIGTVVPHTGQPTRDLAYIHQRSQQKIAAKKKSEGRTRRERKEIKAKRNQNH